MNKTSLENQKKGNLYVYKLGTGSKTPEYHPPTAAAVTKRIISSSLWGIRRSKPRPKPGTDPGTGLDIDQVDNVVENNRRSVSSMEDVVKGYNGNNNNNNNSNSNGNNSSSNKIEETRKSVSHVENNVAYVGKFVEKGRKSIGVKLEIENNKNDDNNSKNNSKNKSNNNSNINSVELSKVELLQVKVLVTDMPGFMQIHAFQCARNTYDTLEKFSAKHLASNLKKEFDKVYGPAWHCIVGSSFGSFVTHATGCFLYFSMEKLCILLFRTKVQRALKQ